MSEWESLPEVILGEIFSYLSTTDRLHVQDVCMSWYYAFLRPEVWKTFVFTEEDVSTWCNIGTGDVYSTHGTSVNALVDMVRKVGKHFRSVKLFYRGSNCNQILNSMAENCSGIIDLKLQRLSTGVHIIRNHDSSCKQAIQSLLQRNRQLRLLDIRDLDNVSTPQQQDPLPFGAPHALRLVKLYLLHSYQKSNLSNLMYLVNLKELAVEPHVLSYSLLYHLASNSLTDLHIVAVSKHVEYYNEALQDWQWQEICKQGSRLRVHCHFGVGHEWTEREIILKKCMPVRSITYLKYRLLEYSTLSNLVCNYCATLEEFIDVSLSLSTYEVAQWHAKAEYNFPVNLKVFDIVLSCPKLQKLAVKEVLCSGTVLVMLYLNKSLQILLMEEQIKYTPYLPSNVTLPIAIHDLIIEGSVDKESFIDTVFKITGKEWHFLSKNELYETIFQKHLKFV